MMKKIATRYAAISLVSCAGILAACSTVEPSPTAGASKPATATKPTTATKPAAPAKADSTTEAKTPDIVHPTGQSLLNDGVELYNKGDYNGAIRRLSGAHEIWISDKPTQLQALKYMAFSYCVTGRQTLCKQQFEKALKLDPSFDLAPGEKGHPLWSPVFDKLKKAK